MVNVSKNERNRNIFHCGSRTALYCGACARLLLSGDFRQGDSGREAAAVEAQGLGLSAELREVFQRGEILIAIVNSVEDNPTDVWMGVNSAGFAIMNTQSFNLVDVAPGEERGAANGRIMRRALEICATVEDFHHFLDTLAKPSMIEASLGVVDAQGGAQMLEVDYYKYVVYDANDPAVAPHGYVARTNFSFTGDVNEGLGQVRYLIEEGLLMPASGMGLFTPQWILTDVARCFENPILGIDLRSGDFNRPKTTGWFIDYDFISRRGSTSSAVVQGVRPGENPELSVMWTILGYPPTGVAMPLWVKGADKYLPSLVARDEATKLSPLCDFSQTLADRVYSYHQGDGTDRYMNWELLWRPSGGGAVTCSSCWRSRTRSSMSRSRLSTDGERPAGSMWDR